MGSIGVCLYHDQSAGGPTRGDMDASFSSSVAKVIPQEIKPRSSSYGLMLYALNVELKEMPRLVVLD